ncbi:MAG: hypothetical protein JO266_13050 [Acidobacteria bacterium]|nr:hypothetical protein [Acidobacteriota bacterium]
MQKISKFSSRLRLGLDRKQAARKKTSEKTLNERMRLISMMSGQKMDHMSDCLMHNKEPLTPGEEGLRDVKIMTAIYKAAQSGMSVKL